MTMIGAFLVGLSFYDWILILLTPGMVLSFYYVVAGYKGFLGFAPEIRVGAIPRLTLLYAAKQVNPTLQRSVDSVIHTFQELGLPAPDVRVVVVSNHRELKDAKVILVPENFQCQSMFKARQLQYALQELPNSKDEWILHLDEDAHITPQTIKSIFRYINNGGNPVANGPTVFPFKGNIIGLFVEAQRAWTYFWCRSQQQSGHVHWMNGSNMLCRSDIEQSVGWNFKNLKFSEDTRFAYEAYKKYGKIFGWHGGLTLEDCPNSIGAALTQRMRWFWGGILQTAHVPKSRLPRRLYSQIAWMMGFVLTVLIPTGIVVGLTTDSTLSNEVYKVYGISASLIIWSLRYQFGLSQHLRHSDIGLVKKIGLHLLIIPASPLIELICTVPTVLGLLLRPNRFVITAKG